MQEISRNQTEQVHVGIVKKAPNRRYRISFIFSLYAIRVHVQTWDGWSEKKNNNEWSVIIVASLCFGLEHVLVGLEAKVSPVDSWTQPCD